MISERRIPTPCSVMFTWPDIYMYAARERHAGEPWSQWPAAWMDTDRRESEGTSAPRRTHASRIAAALRSLMPSLMLL